MYWVLFICGILGGIAASIKIYDHFQRGKPEVIIDRVEDDKNEKCFFVAKNIGKKTALNIRLESIHLNIANYLTTIFEFKWIDNLAPNDEKKVDYDTYVLEEDGRKVPSDSARKLYFGSIFNPKYQKERNHNLRVDYMDSSGKKYITKFSTGKDGLSTKKVCRNWVPKKLYEIFHKPVTKIHLPPDRDLKYS